MKRSMENTYLEGEDGTQFKLPPLKVTHTIKPSIGGHCRHITIYDANGKERSVKYEIPKASIAEASSKLWVNLENVKIPVMNANNEILSSGLGSAFAGAKPDGFTYQNEFAVQNVCMTLVEDALMALGLNQEYVKAHMEISIYAMKPDIIVVIEQDGHIIFPIEIKCPGKEVFTSEHVGGQIWSYLLLMKHLGVRRPMGAIMTYNEIALVTLDDFSEESDHKVILEGVTKGLGTGVQQTLRQNIEAEPACHKRKQSPIRKGVNFSATRTPSQEVKAYAHDKEIARKVFYSKIFKGGAVFPCLLQALNVAYIYGTTDRVQSLTVVDHGDSLASRLVFKVGEASCTWVQTASSLHDGTELKATVANNPLVPQNTKTFYLLGQLGHGGKGSTYVVSNMSGKVAAAKMYCIKPSFKATAEGREEEEKSFRLARFREAQREAELWQNLYKKRFTGVRALFLVGQPCLLMPYGQEIPERWMHMLSIREELRKLAGRNFRFARSDLRWRHVLLDCEKSVFFCDLGSLEKFPGGEIEDVVNAQLMILARAITAEELFAAFTRFLGHDEEDLIKAMQTKEGSGFHTDFKTFTTAMKTELAVEDTPVSLGKLREAGVGAVNLSLLSNEVRVRLLMVLSCLSRGSQGTVDAISPSIRRRKRSRRPHGAADVTHQHCMSIMVAIAAYESALANYVCE